MVAHRDKTLPRIQNTSQNPKHFPECKALPRIQKHFPESKNTSQNPKTLPRIPKHFTHYNTSQNPKHLPESKNTFQNPKHFPHNKTLPTLQNTSQNPKHSPHPPEHGPEHGLRNRCLSSFFKKERQRFRITSLNSVRMALKSTQETSGRHI